MIRNYLSSKLLGFKYLGRQVRSFSFLGVVPRPLLFILVLSTRVPSNLWIPYSTPSPLATFNLQFFLCLTSILLELSNQLHIFSSAHGLTTCFVVYRSSTSSAVTLRLDLDLSAVLNLKVFEVPTAKFTRLILLLIIVTFLFLFV